MNDRLLGGPDVCFPIGVKDKSQRYKTKETIVIMINMSCILDIKILVTAFFMLIQKLLITR